MQQTLDDNLMPDISSWPDDPNPTDWDNIPDRHILPAVQDCMRIMTDELEQLLTAFQEENRKIQARKNHMSRSELSSAFVSYVTKKLFELEQCVQEYADMKRMTYLKRGEVLANSQIAGIETIDISYTEDRVLIRMPYLPKRGREKVSMTNWILQAKLFSMPDLPSFPNACIHFCHVYNRDHPQGPLDVDNFSYKQTIDILAFRLRFSDSPHTFSFSARAVFTTAIPGGTYIEVVRKGETDEDLPPLPHDHSLQTE